MKTLSLFVAIMSAAFLSQAQWEPDERLTNAPDSSLTSSASQRCIASSGESVHVTWCDKRSGNWEIYYKLSTDGGLTWEPDLRLTNDPAISRNPSIAVSGLLVHIVWQDNRDGNMEIYYIRSTDGGVSWETEVRQTNNTVLSSAPVVSANDSWVHIVWTDQNPLSGTSEVSHKFSVNGGFSWEYESCLNGMSANVFNPSVASSGADVYVIINRYNEGNLELYLKHSPNGGLSWDEETTITNEFSNASMPSVSVSGSILHLVWTETRDGNNEIYYKRSLNKGLTWEPDIRLTNHPNEQMYPNIASVGSVVNVVWRDLRDDAYEIYFKRSCDIGLSWEPDTRLSGTFFDSQNPSVSISGSTTHVICYDDHYLNYEITYKRNPTGGTITGFNEVSWEVNPNEIFIWPNPASTILNITFNSPIDENIIMRFTDMSGQTFRINNFTAVEGMNQYTINLDDFRNGIYFIEFINGTNRIFRRVIFNK